MMAGLQEIYSLFSIAGLDIFDKKDAPNWIKEHPHIKKLKKLKKVFEVFGLSNFKDKVKYELKDTTEQDRIILDMLETLSSQVRRIYQEFSLLDDEDPVNGPDIRSMVRFLRGATNALYSARVVRPEGKAKILFDDPVSLNGREIFREGEGIFSAFNKINAVLDKFWKKYPNIETEVIPKSNLVLPPIDSLLTVKRFHKTNTANKEYYVVFSASGDEGAWDICTMSQRGIRSCQSWEAPDEDLSAYNRSLIGSILSKYIGIIYLTSGAETGHDYEKYGTRMLKRCLVRFAINSKNENERVIILDQMYNIHDPIVAKMFVDALQKRTSLKVLDYSSKTITDMPPVSDLSVPGERTLQKLSPEEQPYKDIPFLAKEPAGIEDKWKESVFQTTGKLKLLAQDIYEETLEDLQVDMVERLTDSLTGTRNVSTNLQKAAVHNLDIKLLDLIERTYNMRVNYGLRIKYIQLKMNHLFRDLTRAPLAEMAANLNLKLPSEAETRPAHIRDKIDDAIHSYRMNFYDMFK